MTRWLPCEWETDGIRYRVNKGSKGNGDLVLAVKTPGLFKAPMSLGFICADFFNENEQRLYGAPHQLGGRMYARALQVAMDAGWEHARQTLESQKNGTAGRDAFGLGPWAGAIPWLQCDTCGLGRAELSRNLEHWTAHCTLTPGCAGVLSVVDKLPPIRR